MNKMWPFILCVFLITACGVDLLGRPPFEEMTFSPDYTNISMPDSRTWNVTYEYSTDTTFTGVVRHVSLWYDSGAPFMSHDVLVTTGDFASQEAVDTTVFAHKFFYHWDGAPPSGSINLLHIVPLNAEIFEQLTQISKWNHVTISGREILKIDLFDNDGSYLGFMTDMGCNTILVKSVTLNTEGTPIP